MSWVGGCLFWSLTAVVADDFVDLYDDVLGDAGLYGIAIDHLSEVDALFVILFRRYLAENFKIFGYNYTVAVYGCEFGELNDENTLIVTEKS